MKFKKKIPPTYCNCGITLSSVELGVMGGAGVRGAGVWSIRFTAGDIMVCYKKKLIIIMINKF